MGESKILNTKTIVSVSGRDLSIYTYYKEGVGEIIAFITESVINKQGVDFLENELGYSKTGFDDVSFSLNKNGELIVTANDPNLFFIDDDGYLQMYLTEDEEYFYLSTNEGFTMIEEDSDSNILIEE